MWRFSKVCLGALIVPVLWTFLSLLIQRSGFNPIGNPEVKFQIRQLADSGVVFVGPSVFHQRIDSKYLEKELNTSVKLVTSIGQSTLANIELAEVISAKVPRAKIYVAGHDRLINGTGLHQCWSCSNLSWSILKSEWNEVNQCFWYDAILGLFAVAIPEKKPLPFARTNAEMIEHGGWMESNKRFLANVDESMQRMSERYAANSTLPRSHLYTQLIEEYDNITIVIPPNGRFEVCPADLPCIEGIDSTWINKELWIDGGHLSSLGGAKFTSKMLSTLQGMSQGHSCSSPSIDKKPQSIYEE